MLHALSNIELIKALQQLKSEAGTHSPSIFTLLQQLPSIKIEIDACFLCNPHVTRLVENYYRDLFSNGKILTELLQYYPSQNAAIAKILSGCMPTISPAQIFIGNGAVEIIQAIISHFCGKKMVVILPTFSPYYEFATNNLEVVYYPLMKEQQFCLDVENYVEFVKASKAESVVLITPNNPTGTYITSAEISYLARELSHLESIVIDESFIHFAYENQALERVTNEALIASYPNVIIVKSLSKDFGIAGIRAGYALLAETRVKKLLASGYLWNSNCLAERFFVLLADADFQTQYELLRKQYIRELQDFYQDLSQLQHAKVYPSLANFFLLELNQMSSFDFTIKLLVEHGIYVRDCMDKLGLKGNFVRIAARSEKENKRILRGIKMVLGE